MKKNRKTLIAVIALLLLCAVFVTVWLTLSPSRDTDTFAKTVSVTVIHGDGSSKDFAVKTDAEYLGEALKREKLIEGEDGEFGMYITAADGETADESLYEWWCLCDGEGNMLMSSVDTTPIHDGDSFELILKTGYEDF